MVKKKNIRKSALLLIMIMLATGITACGTEEEPLPDLSAMGAVTAVSREEGSGTRAEDVIAHKNHLFLEKIL